jgi:hypothetical protein
VVTIMYEKIANYKEEKCEGYRAIDLGRPIGL